MRPSGAPFLTTWRRQKITRKSPRKSSRNSSNGSTTCVLVVLIYWLIVTQYFTGSNTYLQLYIVIHSCPDVQLFQCIYVYIHTGYTHMYINIYIYVLWFCRIIPGPSSSLVKLFSPAVAQAQGEPGVGKNGFIRAIEAIAVTGSHSSFWFRVRARQPYRQPWTATKLVG